MLLTIDDVQRLFEEEFSAVRDKFCVLLIPADEVAGSSEEFVWHPGVYVWWHPERGVLKVGRHFTNSRKRALEHIKHNTGGVLKEYGSDPDTRLLLFNVKDPNDLHWVAAVEVFLETKAEPYVRAKRQG